MNDKVTVKKNTNSTIIMNREDINNPLHPNLFQSWLETMGVDPEANEVCLRLSPLDENKPDMRNAENDDNS
jgi:hypothetical protein